MSDHQDNEVPQDDDVDGHRLSALPEEEDDVEGHSQPPRDIDTHPIS